MKRMWCLLTSLNSIVIADNPGGPAISGSARENLMF